MTTFDLTFDRTFGVQVTSGNPVIDGCRKPGAYLTWLTIDGGYMYWLFEGKITKAKPVATRGSRIQAGSIKHNQKETGQVLTIRTANLTELESEAVATIYESVDVWLLPIDADGTFHKIPVSIEPGTFPTWDSSQKRSVLDVTLTLPTRRTQRT